MATDKIAQDFKQVNDDIYISPVTGDFVIEPSDVQHVKDILESEPGWWKEFIQIGAGIRKLLKGKINVQRVESVIKQQLESDGYQVARPKITTDNKGKFTIQPNAKRIRF